MHINKHTQTNYSLCVSANDKIFSLFKGKTPAFLNPATILDGVIALSQASLNIVQN